MRSCIYDKMEECGRSCTGCKAAVTGCDSCGRSDVVYLYENDGKKLCTDCLMEETGQEFYEEFAEVYKEEFLKFFIESNEDIRIPVEY